ncbi:penicillin-binding protein 1A [Amorphus sp. 3PC139-8]|uniref:penicillin-binding protein 1A n=1 Tax=Amorphus sp. 3PC139-8 TaxID=2735676 RepID=UPI00345CEF5C
MRFLVNTIGYLVGIGVVLGLIAAGAVGYYVYMMSEDLPDYTQLRNYEPPVMTRIHASDGSLVAEYAREKRLFLPIQAIPAVIKEAFLSAEDKTFYTHNGIDLGGIVRAAVTNFRNRGSGRRPVGASTITQQVAKNFLLTNEVSIERKIKEAILALRIEQAYTKDRILELYLNEIYLGMGAYGVAAAALVYFDKSVHELSIAEVAYLAALPKAPNNYNPFREPARAIERRNWVIDRMLENGYITESEAEQAKNEPLKVTPRDTGSHLFASDYFAEEVRRHLANMYGEKGLYEGGLSVRTTLNPELQVMARNALMDGLIDFDVRRTGWRGPVTTVDLGNGADWGARVGEVNAYSDLPEWRLAVVLSVDGNEAQIGLQPERLVSGALSIERERGRIPFKDVAWRRIQHGPKPGQDYAHYTGVRNMTDLLQRGDVVYVEKDESADGDDVYNLRQVPEVSGAIVAMDPHTGRVLAMVGGFSFAESEFNRATQAYRQPGSSFKPFVYATALDNGYTPASIVVDGPIEIDPGAGQAVWRPKNYGGKYAGPRTLRYGIERSRNLMTVRLAKDMGMPLIVEYARRFGIYDNLKPFLSMSLGAGETTVMRMVGAYSIIANSGQKVTPTLIDRIQDRYGRTIYRHDDRICQGCVAESWHDQPDPTIIDESEYVLDPMTAYQITSMMEGVVQRGTATRVRAVGKPIAGKTGTTNDERDAWFVGFTPDLVAGVYVGYDNPRPMGRGATGGQVAAPIFIDFMKSALADTPGVEFRVPEGIKLVPVYASTGQPAPSGGAGVILEAFKPGTAPGDTFSVIGLNSGKSSRSTVTRESERAVLSGTGGLY